MTRLKWRLKGTGVDDDEKWMVMYHAFVTYLADNRGGCVGMKRSWGVTIRNSGRETEAGISGGSGGSGGGGESREIDLGAWINQQKLLYQKGRLRPDRIALLQVIYH